jgi:cell division protein FtsL
MKYKTPFSVAQVSCRKFFSRQIKMNSSVIVKHRQIPVRKIFLFSMLLIVISTLVYSIWIFQRQLVDSQDQIFDLQEQIKYYENLTDTIQTQVSTLEAKLHDLQNPKYNVTITNVSSTSWMNLVGVTSSKEFYITIKNLGDRDIGGLTTDLKILTNGKVADQDGFDVYLASPILGVLNPQESKVITVWVDTGYSVSTSGKSIAFTLMLDKTVLDTQTLSL